MAGFGFVRALWLLAVTFAATMSLVTAPMTTAQAVPAYTYAAACHTSAATLTSGIESGAAHRTSESSAAAWASAVALCPRGSVAAEAGGADVPTVVFSRSRAPGIADNFDNAVADGAPTQLNRVSGAARDANGRVALRGQAPAPAGQSLDEYPFACSAQGGCGSFVGAVPVGEQSYQGGVLSRFFQNNGVGVGDPFNVMFGP